VNTFVNSVNDSHSGSFNAVLGSRFSALYLPVQIKVVDDKVVVFRNYNDSLAKLNDLRRGDVIESIDGKSIKQLIDERKDLVNGSNYAVKLRSLINYNFLTGGRDSSVSVVRSVRCVDIYSGSFATGKSPILRSGACFRPI